MAIIPGPSPVAYAPEPYITGELVTTNSTTVIFTFLYYGDKLFYRTYSSYTSTFSSYISLGQIADNFYYNGLSTSISFSRNIEHSYFQTIHCRMYNYEQDLIYVPESSPEAYRSYYQSIYVPQLQYAPVTDDKMFYITFTGKDITSIIYINGVSNGNIIYQSHLYTLYNNANVGYLIDSTTSKNWFTASHSTTYYSMGETDNPTYSSSYPWPW